MFLMIFNNIFFKIMIFDEFGIAGICMDDRPSTKTYLERTFRQKFKKSGSLRTVTLSRVKTAAGR